MKGGGSILRIADASLHAHLFFLVLVALRPALGLILHTAFEQRRLATACARNEALRMARLAALEQSRVFEGARQLLVGLEQSPAVLRQDGAACSSRFSTT